MNWLQLNEYRCCGLVGDMHLGTEETQGGKQNCRNSNEKHGWLPSPSSVLQSLLGGGHHCTCKIIISYFVHLSF